MSSTAQSEEPPRVDLPQIPQPPIPPSPVQHDPEPQARVSVAYQTRLSSLPGVGTPRGNGSSPLDTPGLVGRGRTGVQYLSELVNDVDRVGYLIEVRRVGPAIWEGSQLPCGPVGPRLQPMTYLEIYNHVRDLHGGGDYRIHVIDDIGRVVQQIPFRIDTVTEPPKFVDAMGSVNSFRPAATPMYRSGMPNGRPYPGTHAAGEEDELVKLRNEERKVASEIAVKVKKREGDLLERRWQEEEEARLERQEKKKTEPVLAMNQQIQTIERQMSQQTQQFMQAMQQQQQAMQQQFQQLLLMMANKKDDGGQLLMIESMKAQQSMMTTLVTAMMASSNHKAQESEAQIRAKADADHKFFEMMMRMTQGGGAKYEKLVESLISAQLNKPQDSVQQAISLLEMGRQQTMEMLEFRDKNREDEPTMDYDPELGVGSNLAKLLFGMLRGLMKGGGGIPGVAAVLQALNKTDTSQVQTSDLRQLASTLENQYGQQFQRLQTAQPVQQTQNTVPLAFSRVAQQQQPRPVVQSPFEATFEEEEITQQVQVQVPVAVAVAPSAIIEEDEEDDDLPEGMEDTPDGRLRWRVNEMIRIATVDLKDGVRAPEWTDYALDKLNEEFLDALVAAKDDAERVVLIQSKSEPALFQQLYAMLADEKNRSKYEKFVSGLHEIIAEHAKERSALAVAGA